MLKTIGVPAIDSFAKNTRRNADDQEEFATAFRN